MSKIKNPILASLLKKIGVEVKAELVVDDANGTSLTFPDIADVAEIAEGVAVDAPDGTYVIANGDESLTVVVMSGLVTSVTDETAEATTEATNEGIDAEVLQVLEAITDQVQALKTENASVKAELKSLKASLKHEPEDKGAPNAKAGDNQQFKIVG